MFGITTISLYQWKYNRYSHCDIEGTGYWSISAIYKQVSAANTNTYKEVQIYG